MTTLIIQPITLPRSSAITLVAAAALPIFIGGGLRFCGPSTTPTTPPPLPMDAGVEVEAGAPDVAQADAAAEDAAPEDLGPAPDTGVVARVHVVAPTPGARVSSPVSVEIAAEGINIEPQSGVVRPGAGSFVLFMDVDCPPAGTDTRNVDAYVIHLRGGERGAQVELSVGPHTICAGVEDGAHKALEPRDDVAVTVE